MTTEPPDQPVSPPGENPPPPSGSRLADPHSTPPPGAIRAAGYFQRIVALVVDAIVMAVPLTILALGAAAVAPFETGPCSTGNRLATCDELTDTGVLIALAAVGLGFLVVALYHSILIGTRGATLGQRVVGIRVVDLHTGDLIGTARALGRFLLRPVSSAFCFLGFLWMVWDPRSQTWHDKMTSCLVVQA